MTVDPPEDRARKIVSSILKATQRDASQTAIAAAMGVSESTVSRLLSDHLDKLALVMAHAGLRVVGQDMRCFPPDYVDALLLMAALPAAVARPASSSWRAAGAARDRC